jgi:hypothetical protein
MDRREELLQEKLTAAKAAGAFEVVYRVVLVEDEDEDAPVKRIKTRKMEIFTPVFLYTVNFRKGVFRVSRFADKCPKAMSPTIFSSWMRAAENATQKWILHAEMNLVEFLTWLKTALGDRAYRAYAELIA